MKRPWVRTRLSAMMFAVYLALGTWAVTASTYLAKAPDDGGLGFRSSQVAWIYSTFALGAIIANPLIGLLADRLFRAERLLGVVSGLCAICLIAAGAWCEIAQRELAASADAAFGPLFGIMLAYAIFLQLAMPLCAVITLRNLPDPTNQYSRTRMWGTIGWIVVGLTMAWFLNPVSHQPFYLGGAVMFALALYAFTLPKTPPRGHGKTLGECFGLPALALFRKPSFRVYILGALTLAILNQFYGVHGHRYLTQRGWDHPERWMTLGQFVEVGCMFAIPLLNPKRNMKWLMLIGAIGGSIRGLALGWGPDWLGMAVGVPMHGWNFAFYFVVGAAFVDHEAPPHLRASAQAISTFVTSGVGPLLGNLLAAEVLDAAPVDGARDWTGFWMWPLVGCGIVAALFAIFFRTPRYDGEVRIRKPAKSMSRSEPEPVLKG